jgi:heat shock protein HspQ
VRGQGFSLAAARHLVNGGSGYQESTNTGWYDGRNPIISVTMSSNARIAKYKIGAVVKHRVFPFRGVVFDVDPTFSNTDEWYESIPAEVRPHKDQPFYHLFAENAETEYIAYVSEQNLLPDTSGEPVRHPQVKQVFERDPDGGYRQRNPGFN